MQLCGSQMQKQMFACIAINLNSACWIEGYGNFTNSYSNTNMTFKYLAPLSKVWCRGVRPLLQQAILVARAILQTVARLPNLLRRPVQDKNSRSPTQLRFLF